MFPLSIRRHWFNRARLAGGATNDVALIDRPLLDETEISTLVGEAYAAADKMLTRPDVQYRHAGDMRSIYLGQGLDFEESRLYQRGDDLRSMDWRTTARTGKAYVKVFREEHQAAIHVLVDRGASMRFATRGRLKVTQAARLAVLAAFSAVRKGASVGGSIVQPERIFIPAASGKIGALHLIEAAVAPAPPLGQSNTGLGFWAALEMLESVLSRGTKLILISDFQGFDRGYQNTITRLAYRNEVVPMIIVDPSELELPDVGVAIFSGATDTEAKRIDTHDAALRRDFAERQRAAQAGLLEYFSAIGIQAQICLTTADMLPYP